jgi:hypothetical protein
MFIRNIGTLLAMLLRESIEKLTASPSGIGKAVWDHEVALTVVDLDKKPITIPPCGGRP